jgi:hypothetical protein
MSADSAAQNRAPIPDLSGNWAHPFLTGFEPPASGPGPVLNTARRPDGVANFQQLVGDHTNPILKPHAAEIVKKHGEQSRAGIGYRTPSNQCRPQGVPYIFWDFTMQMLEPGPLPPPRRPRAAGARVRDKAGGLGEAPAA